MEEERVIPDDIRIVKSTEMPEDLLKEDLKARVEKVKAHLEELAAKVPGFVPNVLEVPVPVKKVPVSLSEEDVRNLNLLRDISQEVRNNLAVINTVAAWEVEFSILFAENVEILRKVAKVQKALVEKIESNYGES